MSDEPNVLSSDTLVDLWDECGEDWTWNDVLSRANGDEEIAALAWVQICKLKKIDQALVQAGPKSPEPPPTHSAESLTFADLDTVSTISTFVKKAELEHGIGGVGLVVVYHDERFDRDVAVKFLRKGGMDAEDATKLFRHEAEITAKLDHPGIPPILSYGETDTGIPFFVMRLIKGTTYGERISELHHSSLDEESNLRDRLLRSLLSQLAAVCKIASYAHDRGVIHRDLKPQNIRVDRYGEVIVLDWGVSVLWNPNDSQRSNDYSRIHLSRSFENFELNGGTPSYVSPEVWSGCQPSPANDVYALGVILYELLAGSLPIIHTLEHGAMAMRTCKADYIDIAVASEKLGKYAGKHDLCAIVRKAMSVVPESRYQSASDMARDLECVLADTPVSVRKSSLSTRLMRSIRRHRATSMTIGLLLLLVAGVSTGLSFLLLFEYQQYQQAEQRALAQGILALTERDALLSTLADFAADQVARELEFRFTGLRELASSPPLPEMIAQASDKDANAILSLNNFLETTGSAVFGSQIGDSLWVQNLAGIQLSRYPLSDSIGKSFAYRQYFHGLIEDLPENETAQMLQKPNLSIVYASTSGTNSYRIALTYPIQQDGKYFGLVGMSVELNKLASLRMSRNLEGTNLALADWRLYKLNGKQRSGAIIHRASIARDAGLTKSREVAYVPGSVLAADIGPEGRWIGEAESLENQTLKVQTSIATVDWQSTDGGQSKLNFGLPPLRIVVQR